MTDQQLPITPPPELIAKWASSMCGYYEAARWGADQELEACCEWLEGEIGATDPNDLHRHRRPKPNGPTRRQLMMLADGMGMAYGLGDVAEYARAVLARWGNL